MAEELSFEEAFDELKKTVARLEEEELPLEEALKLFERGTMLAQRCETLLDQAELRLKQLVPSNEGDDHDMAPFDEL
ncbi:MAG: exodeoxyribonuclease VII small subunit [Chloroflexi bacterium]|nr:MAG: exodeoxyribonuclease VII small subunit [Chloroflexota bacterium]